MNRLSDNDKNWGPITLGSWSSTISARISSGDDEGLGTHFLLTAFGRALRIKLPNFLKPCGKYGEWETEYGFSLSKEGNGYDFLQVFFGGQHEYDGPKNRKSWFLPWKQWDHVRHEILTPEGKVFAREEKGKWQEFYAKMDEVPKLHFALEDYDGTPVIAICYMEEREWHRGEKWFSWLKYFYPAKIRRSMDIRFDKETGPEKGSWKGGTIGHGIDMLPGEDMVRAMVRYCTTEKRSKYKNFMMKFVGPCGPPPPRPDGPAEGCCVGETKPQAR